MVVKDEKILVTMEIVVEESLGSCVIYWKSHVKLNRAVKLILPEIGLENNFQQSSLKLITRCLGSIYH